MDEHSVGNVPRPFGEYRDPSAAICGRHSSPTLSPPSSPPPGTYLMVVPYEATNVGVELKGVRGGVERRRGRGLKAGGGRTATPGKVLKERRSPRGRGRMGTSAR